MILELRLSEFIKMEENSENDSNSLSSMILNFLNSYQLQQVKRDNIHFIEYETNYQTKRFIQIDEDNNHIVVYTFDDQPVLKNIPEEVALRLLAAMNYILPQTSIEMDTKNYTFCYKSSQTFPSQESLLPVFERFLQQHDAHFGIIKKFFLENQPNNGTKESSLMQYAENFRKALLSG